MKKLFAIVVIAALAALWYATRVPDVPTRVIEAEVLSLIDVDGTGLRRITVRLPDGAEREIETLAPFFFKPGHKAKVGIYERRLFDDVYDIVGDWTIDAQS